MKKNIAIFALFFVNLIGCSDTTGTVELQAKIDANKVEGQQQLTT
jgi:hypothetical protein